MRKTSDAFCTSVVRDCLQWFIAETAAQQACHLQLDAADAAYAVRIQLSGKMTHVLAIWQAAEKAHIQRCRAETVAMRAEPMKRYLMQQLMPVLAKAMVEAAEEQAADPVQFVAHKLLEVRLRLMSLGTGLIKGVSVLDAMILYSSLSLDRHQSAFWSDPNTSCDAQLIAGQVAAKLTVSWHTNKHCPGCRYL